MKSITKLNFTPILLLLSTSAFAAPRVTSGYMRQSSYSTLTSINLYVDSSGIGNDAGWCDSASAPCATLAGVFAKIPPNITNPVNVSMAAGNYAGAILPNFTIQSGAYLSIGGTPIAYNPPSGGLQTFTAATVSAGSCIDTSNRSTVTVTNGNWTDAELRTYQLCLTNPNGQQQCHIIDDNNHSGSNYTITISGCFTDCRLLGGGTCAVPTANVTSLSIAQPGAVINSAVSWPATAMSDSTVTSVALGITGFVQPLQNTTLWAAQANNFVMGDVVFHDIKVAVPGLSASSTVSVLGAAAVRFVRMRFDSGSTPSAIRVRSSQANIWISDSASIIGGTNSALVYADPADVVFINGSYQQGGRGIFRGVGTVRAAQVRNNTMRACYECERPGVLLTYTSQYNKIDGALNGGFRCGAGDADSCHGIFYVTNNIYTNCNGGIAMTGDGVLYLDVTAPNVVSNPASSITTTSGCGLNLSGFSHTQIASTTAFSSASTDVCLSTASSIGPNSSITAFRALSPPVLCSTNNLACIVQ